jgi:hypothetical protein
VAIIDGAATRVPGLGGANIGCLVGALGALAGGVGGLELGR